MAYMNRVFLAGNLTRDPEIRYLPSGTAVADMGMAISRKYKTGTGEQKTEVCFVHLKAWARQAELAGQYLKKGSAVLVEGSLRYEEWESNDEKREKRNRLIVNADRLQFLDRAKRPESGPPAEDEAAAPREAPAAENGPAAPAAEKGADKGDADDLPF